MKISYNYTNTVTIIVVNDPNFCIIDAKNPNTNT